MPSTLPTLYAVLGVSQHAEKQDIKRAYHRTLLSSHPDKSSASSSSQFDAALVKQAYTTLSTPHLRQDYDRSLTKNIPVASQSRPAQIVSIEDFDDCAQDEWSYGCRCGSLYRINASQMECDIHLVGCEGCSEAIWVGYEVVEDDPVGSADPPSEQSS